MIINFLRVFASWRLGVKSFAALLGLVILALCSCRRPTAEVVVGGDVMFDRGVRRMADSEGWDHTLSGISPLLHQADLALANLECPLTARTAAVPKSYSFRCDPGSSALLRSSGFTAMTLANNHSGDYGRAGVVDTIANLHSAGLIAIGAGEDQDRAAAARYVEVNGVRIALLGFVDLALEGMMSSMTDLPGPAFADRDRVAAAISAAKSNSDFVLVTVHWGREYRLKPSPRQRSLARLMADSGADLIVGHHPHVIQSVEFIGDVPVFYSVGNLVFDQTAPERTAALLVRARVWKNGRAEFFIMPIRISNCRPAPAEDADADAIVAGLHRTSILAGFGKPEKGWTEVFRDGY